MSTTPVQAGRELDAEIARRVFDHAEIIEWTPGYPVYYERVSDKEMVARPLPPYSTDIGAAWLIVEETMKRRWVWFLDADGSDGQYSADISCCTLARTISVFGATMPEAICRAALACVGAT